jgi:hypothetical protein
MKCTFVNNGKSSLALTPDTDLEKMLLQELFKNPDIESHTHEKLQILDKAVNDTVVISLKTEIQS